MGAGGVGAYFGACLLRAGNHVTFLARGPNLQALRDGGITVSGAMGDFTVPNVVATDAPTQKADLVLLATKTYDLSDACAAVRGCGGLVVTLQNGVEAPSAARELLGDVVLAGSTGIVSDLVEHGHVHCFSAYAWIRFGEPGGGGRTGRVEDVREVLSVDGIEAIAVDDSRVALWEKWALMCGMAGLTTLLQRPIGAILNDTATRATFLAVVHECEAVGRAINVPLGSGFSVDRMEYADQIEPEAMSSMSRDFARGKRVELETFNGAAVRLGARAGVEVPANAEVYDGIRERLAEGQLG